MAIPRKLILLWLGLACAFAALLFMQWQQARQGFVSVPKKPQTIQIKTDLAAFTWQRTENGWHMDGKPANGERIHDWLGQLRGCHGAYSPSEIAPSDNPYPVVVTIDGEVYHLGAANPFANANYLTHRDKIYLCNQAVKAALRLSSELWLETPDA